MVVNGDKLRFLDLTGKVLAQVSVFLSRTTVSFIILLLLEGYKFVIDSALFFMGYPESKKDSLLDTVISEYVVPCVELNPVFFNYTSQYVVPALQFTSIYQIYGNQLCLFGDTELSKKLIIVVSGMVRATSSVSVQVISKIRDGKNITLKDVSLPFSKEPVVSVCKVYAEGTNFFIVSKIACNFLGDISHNIAKVFSGSQKSSFIELLIKTPVVVVWKTTHQMYENIMVTKIFDAPLGFYFSNLLPRSYGNSFIESWIDSLGLQQNNSTSFDESVGSDNDTEEVGVCSVTQGFSMWDLY